MLLQWILIQEPAFFATEVFYCRPKSAISMADITVVSLSSVEVILPFGNYQLKLGIWKRILPSWST